MSSEHGALVVSMHLYLRLCSAVVAVRFHVQLYQDTSNRSAVA